MHPLLRYALVATPLCALLFLGASGFFTGWDGHVVGRRPTPSGDRAVDTVLLVTADGSDSEVDWPGDVVTKLDVPIETRRHGPARVPADAPATHKSRYGLHFTVTADDGAIVARLPVLRPASVAALAWLLGLAVTNLLRSGSPLSWEKRAIALPAPLPGDLQETKDAPTRPPTKASKPRFGPPPRKPRRGVGR
jgi:hypothetical protein